MAENNKHFFSAYGYYRLGLWTEAQLGGPSVWLSLASWIFHVLSADRGLELAGLG